MKIRGYFTPFMLSCACLYFTYHLFQGDRGVIAWRRIQNTTELKANELTVLTAKQLSLSQKTRLLKPTSLCKDMLTAQAHTALNHAKKDEFVIYLN